MVHTYIVTSCLSFQFVCHVGFLFMLTFGQPDVTPDACATIGNRFRIQLVLSNPATIITWKRLDKIDGILSTPVGNQCYIVETYIYNLTKYTFTCDTKMYTMDINSISNDDVDYSWEVTVDERLTSSPIQVRLCVGTSGQPNVLSDGCATIGNRFRIQLVISNPLYIGWKRSDMTTSSIISVPRGNQCGIQNSTDYDLTRYTFTCDTNIFSMDIRSISIDDLGLFWTIDVNGQQTSSKPQVWLCVPVTMAMVTNPSSNEISVMEGVSSKFVCETSPCRPEATVIWYKQGVTAVEHVTTQTATAIYAATPDSLIITTSTMYYNVSRKDMNYKIYCKAKNNDQDTVTSEHQPKINVLYSPVDGPVIQNYSGTNYYLLENATLTLTCIITGGNPRPTLTWTCNGGTTMDTSSGTDASVKLTWKAERGKDGPCTCTSYHPAASSNRSDFVNVVILYPSTVSRFQINNDDVNCTVNENSTVLFLCGVDSNPLSFVYINATTYYGESRLTEIGPPKEEVQHTLQIATCYDSGIYRCIGQNNYTSQPVFLDNRLFVRCSPRPRYDVGQNITFHTALGFSVTLNLTLIAFPEPLAERFKWEKVDGENTTEIINSTHIQINTTGLATTLTIDNLKQTDFGQYRLCVNYTYIHYFFISPPGTDVVTTSDFSKAAIGGVVGGVSALVMIVVVVVVFIRRKKGSKDSEEHGYETPQSRTMSSEIDNAYNTLHTVEQVESDPTAYYNLERNPYEDLNREQGQYHEYGTLNISDDTEMNDKRSDDKMYENLRLSPMQLE